MPAATIGDPPAAGVRRSAHLLRAFRLEQTEPALFYGAVARDAIGLLRPYGALSGRLVLDVGAGPVQFAEAFAAAGAR